MSKDLVELLNDLHEVYELILERVSHSCETTESDDLFLKIYQRYICLNLTKNVIVW